MNRRYCAKFKQFLLLLVVIIFVSLVCVKPIRACAPWQDASSNISSWYGCTATSTWFDMFPTYSGYDGADKFKEFTNAIEFHDSIQYQLPEKASSSTNGPPLYQVMRRYYRVKEDEFPANDITALAIDPDGAIYAGTEKHGLIIIEPMGDQWVSLNSEGETALPAIHCLRFDSAGTLWIGTMGGLYSLIVDPENGGWESFFQEGLNTELLNSLIVAGDGLKDNICLCVEPSPDGQSLWIGTSKGLVHKTGDKYKKYTDTDGLPANMILSLEFNVSGELLVGTAAGVVSLTFANDQTNFQLIEFKPPSIAATPHPWIYGLKSNSLQTTTMPIIRTTVQAIKDGFAERVENYRSSKYSAQIFEGTSGYVNQDLPEGKVLDLDLNIIPFLETFYSRAEVTYLATNDRMRIFRSDYGTYNSVVGANLADASSWYSVIARDKVGRVYAVTKQLELAAECLLNGWEEKFLTKSEDGSLREILKQTLLDGDVSQEDVQITLYEGGVATLKAENILSQTEPTAMVFAPDNSIWISLKGVGLFHLSPTVFDYCTIENALRQCSTLVNKGFVTAPVNTASTFNGKVWSKHREGPGFIEPIGFDIKSVQQPLPSLDIIYRGIYSDIDGRRLCPKSAWVGRWSHLNEDEALRVATFLGRWGDLGDLVGFLHALPEDPFIIIPRGQL